MITKEQALRIKDLIEQYENIVLFHHTNPDGDCMATSFGLASALMKNYPNKNIKVVADIEDYTPHLRYMDKYIDWDKTITTPEHDDYLAIIGDVSGVDRVRFFENFEGHIKDTVVYDHHENELNIPNTTEFWSQPKYPAAGLMAYELVKAMDLELDQISALIINHGILTDTGFYRFAPGNEYVFKVSGEMNSIIGVELQKELYVAMSMQTLEDVKFKGFVLDNFKTAEGKVAYMCITAEDIERLGYKPPQAARVNHLAAIEGIESWLFFIQYEDFVRVEFRSLNIFVNEIATEFGGGGHNHASGCRLESMEDHTKVVDRVLEVIKERGL